MKLKLANRKTAVMAYEFAVVSYSAYMNKHDAHREALALAVECLRCTYEGKDETFDEKEAGVQVVRDLMVSGLLRVHAEVKVHHDE